MTNLKYQYQNFKAHEDCNGKSSIINFMSHSQPEASDRFNHSAGDFSPEGKTAF